MDLPPEATDELLEAFERVTGDHARTISAVLDVIESLVAAQGDAMELIELLSAEVDALKAAADAQRAGDEGRDALRAQAAQSRRQAAELTRQAHDARERSKTETDRSR